MCEKRNDENKWKQKTLIRLLTFANPIKISIIKKINVDLQTELISIPKSDQKHFAFFHLKEKYLISLAS